MQKPIVDKFAPIGQHCDAQKPWSFFATTDTHFRTILPVDWQFLGIVHVAYIDFDGRHI